MEFIRLVVKSLARDARGPPVLALVFQLTASNRRNVLRVLSSHLQPVKMERDVEQFACISCSSRLAETFSRTIARIPLEIQKVERFVEKWERKQWLSGPTLIPGTCTSRVIDRVPSFVLEPLEDAILHRNRRSISTPDGGISCPYSLPSPEPCAMLEIRDKLQASKSLKRTRCSWHFERMSERERERERERGKGHVDFSIVGNGVADYSMDPGCSIDKKAKKEKKNERGKIDIDI